MILANRVTYQSVFRIFAPDTIALDTAYKYLIWTFIIYLHFPEIWNELQDPRLRCISNDKEN